jgi:hypothetical protein
VDGASGTSSSSEPPPPAPHGGRLARAAARLEDVDELHEQQRKAQELRADDERAVLAAHDVEREEDKEEGDDRAVDEPVHAAHRRHVPETRDRRHPLQVEPHDLQHHEEAAAEEHDAVVVQPRAVRLPVPVHDRGDADAVVLDAQDAQLQVQA